MTNAVKTTTQTLTDTQKQQARTNIGAGTSSFDGDYNSLTNKPTIPTKTSQLTNDSGFITDAALTGYAKTTDIPTKTSQLDNDSHYITANEAPVTSVNNKTGAVQLNATDVGALPDTTVIPTKTSQLDNDSGFITSAPVTSVNTKTGAVTLSASDVSAIPSTLTGTAGQVLTKTADGQEWKDAAKELPTVTASDNGKFMRVVSGAWAAAEGDASFDITGASTGQSPIINAVDAAGKPTAWGAAVLAKADGSNIPTDSGVMGTWRDKIAALPGVKVYGKADANGKIMAYTDAACTKEVGVSEAMGLVEYGNALLIYDHKTYQCVGFEEPASMQGSGYYLVAVFFRSEIVADSSGAILKVETAKLNIMDYMSSVVNAPIIITAGELPLTTITTT